jgi:hypothetical protein
VDGETIGERPGWSAVVCVATGPSFDEEQAEFLRNLDVPIIAVNDAFKRLPNAAVIYACDIPWWKLNVEAARKHGAELWSQDKRAPEFGIRYVKGERMKGLCRKPSTISVGINSGFQSMGLAYLFGAKRIVLVGFDCQKTGGKSHYFGDHPMPLSRTHSYAIWIKHYNEIAPDLEADGVTVINASKATALTCFRRSTLQEVFA